MFRDGIHTQLATRNVKWMNFLSDQPLPSPRKVRPSGNQSYSFQTQSDEWRSVWCFSSQLTKQFYSSQYCIFYLQLFGTKKIFSAQVAITSGRQYSTALLGNFFIQHLLLGKKKTRSCDCVLPCGVVSFIVYLSRSRVGQSNCFFSINGTVILFYSVSLLRLVANKGVFWCKTCIECTFDF